MPLIVEDGSVVLTANSYVSLVDARIRAAIYGLILPVDDTEAENALVIGGIWTVQQESSLQGDRIDPAQVMSFPRYPVCIYNST